MKNKVFWFIPAGLIALSGYAWGYIDPGSAGALLQLLMAAIVGFLSYIVIAKKKVINFIKRIFKKD